MSIELYFGWGKKGDAHSEYWQSPHFCWRLGKGGLGLMIPFYVGHSMYEFR